jgi:hypothetical protein
MDRKPDKTERNKSDYVSPKNVISEVIKSLESVDRKLEAFYEIHGTEMQVTPNNRSDFRRLK